MHCDRFDSIHPSLIIALVDFKLGLPARRLATYPESFFLSEGNSRPIIYHNFVFACMLFEAGPALTGGKSWRDRGFRGGSRRRAGAMERTDGSPGQQYTIQHARLRGANPRLGLRGAERASLGKRGGKEAFCGLVISTVMSVRGRQLVLCVCIGPIPLN